MDQTKVEPRQGPEQLKYREFAPIWRKQRRGCFLCCWTYSEKKIIYQNQLDSKGAKFCKRITDQLTDLVIFC